MKQFRFIAFSSLLMLTMGMQAQTKEKVTQYVNPFIGTGAVNENSLMGNTFPGATTPFGLVQLSPDTKDDPNYSEPSGYVYSMDHIFGFSHTHLNGTGCPDLLDVMVMPTSKDLESLTKTKNYSQAYSHSSETAVPGFYSVMLNDDQVKAELTATTHTGMHRYTFQKGGANNLVFDMVHYTKDGRIYDAELRLLDDYTLEGFRLVEGWQKFRKVYFYAKFSRPVKSKILTSDNRIFRDGDVTNGRSVRAFLSFGEGTEPLLVKVALSAVSYDNARQNMDENKGWDFDAVRRQADEAWEKELGNIRIDATKDQKTIFYTGLYHAYTQPNQISDLNGEYMKTDFTTGKLSDGDCHYSTFSLWDTFRAAHPLYTLLKQDRVAGFVNSMIRQYDTYGYLPIWQLWGTENYCMIGNHAIPVLVDAALKHIPGIDINKVYEAVKGSSMREHLNSPFKIWEKYGYMPEDLQTQSVSITLEMAYNDACVARLAKYLGKTEDYEHFNRRAHFYRNLFDKSTGFFHAKNSDGKWLEPFDPMQYGANGGNPFTEANAWQYLWYVPQDVPDFISLFGGAKNFEKKLDAFFTTNAPANAEKNGNASGFIGQYAHGNEPSHHIAYLYDYVGKPEKGAYYANKVMNEQYLNRIDGYSGNEDCGQMSSWYIWSSMGFYPTDPASGRYDFGSPQFKQVTIDLPNGKQFVIKTNRQGRDDYKVKRIQLNGRPVKEHFITHDQIMAGGTLVFTMTK